MKRPDLFNGKPPAVLRMDARWRPYGWRQELLRTLDPLSAEAFMVCREPLSIAERKAIDRDCEAIMRRIENLPSLEEHEALSAEIAQRRGATPGAAVLKSQIKDAQHGGAIRSGLRTAQR